MDDLRAAIDRAIAPTPATRLVAIDAAGLVASTALAVYVALVGPTAPTGIDASRVAVADPLRLPLIEGVADVVLVRYAATADPVARLREIWRILAPAGRLVLVVPLPPPHHLKRLIFHDIIRRRGAGWLAAAMFTGGDWQTTTGGFVVVAGKSDGLAPPARITRSVQRRAPA